MHALSLDGAAAVERVLAIGCHADDIEIGCGGTILTLLARNPELEVTWLVLSAEGERGGEAETSARGFLSGARKSPQIVLESFRDSFFPYEGGAVKEAFEQLKPTVAPQIVFTHSSEDLHQDHRLAAELTWNTFRDHLILEFEIPKYDADLRAPNVFVPLDRAIVDRKIELLLHSFGSQRSKHWFTDDLFRGLMRLRGMEANSPTGYAEAFRCRKLQLAA
jgi:LmbE family N-acetylglucosaminyl deacetylase